MGCDGPLKQNNSKNAVTHKVQIYVSTSSFIWLNSKTFRKAIAPLSRDETLLVSSGK